MIYYVIYICAASLSHHECDEITARAYQSYAKDGIVCGHPSQMAEIASSAIAPREDEYLKIRCRVDRRF